MRRSGQVSSLLKPIQIVIFATIFVTVIGLFLNFELGLSEQGSQLDFQAAGVENYKDIAGCLSSANRDLTSFNLDKDKMEEFERRYQDRQLPCASIPGLGYNVSVSQEYVQGISKEMSQEKPVQVAFVLDDTASMEASINGVRNNVRAFLGDLNNGKGAIVTYKDSAEVDQGFTENIGKLRDTLDKVKAKGGGYPKESVSEGLNTALNLDWDEDSSKAVILTNNDGANNCNRISDLAEEASDKNIKVFTINGFSSGIDYSPAEGCRDEIENNAPSKTGGGNYELGEPWTEILDAVSVKISGQEKTYGAETTCSLPAVEEYSGKVDIAVVADASQSYESEWSTICGPLKNSLMEMREKGLDASISFYAPGNPGAPGNGQGSPMTVNGDSYDHRSASNVPSCLSGFNNASSSSHGKGITKWNSPGVPSYNSDFDYGYEAWGVYSKWVLENHDWRTGTDSRRLFVFGDHVPTGGTGDSTAYNQGASDVWSGKEIVENITGKAQQEDIEVYTFTGDNWEYERTSNLPPSDENDAETLMQNFSRDTGGEFLRYDEASEIASEVTKTFRELKTEGNRNNFCNNSFSFGQSYNPPEDTVDSRSRMTYPVSVSQKNGLVTPGKMTVEYRSGDLAWISGAIQQLIQRGERTGEPASTSFRFDTSARLNTTEKFIKKKPVTSTYKLYNQESGDSQVEFSDELVIGVNGEEVFRGSSEADFSRSENHFEAYRGASIQHIAVNNNEATGMKLDPLGLKCVDCSSTEEQSLTEGVDADKGTTEYKKRGEIGAFSYDSHKISIGREKEENMPAVCLESGGEKACNSFNIEAVSELDLQPGNYILYLEYFPEQDQLVIED